MTARSMAAFILAVAVAGCSSVKLDDVPVDSKTPQSTGQTTPRTESAVPQVTTGQQTDPTRGPAGVATLVYFDFDSYVVKPEYQSVIDGHARFLKANPSRRVALEGHTDERGGREYNLALGQRRSEAVRKALGLLGVPDAQMEAVSFGKEKPVATGADEESYARNRRVEIVYR